MPYRSAPARARRVPRRLTRTAALMACAVGFTVVPSAQAATVTQLDEQGVTRIIVKREDALSARQRAAVRAEADVSLIRQLALPETELVRAAPGELAEAVARLERHPGVIYAEPDVLLSGMSSDPLWSDLWGLDNGGQAINGTAGLPDADVDAPEAWRLSSGEGATVAVIDSGVDFAHPDLEGQFAVNAGESGDGREANGVDDDGNGFVDHVRGWHWVGGDNLPDDVNGHGTHVAGVLAARRDNDLGVTGIAPAAKLVALRVLDANRNGYASAAAEAMHYAGRQGYRVVNASLGGTTYVKALQDAIAEHPGTLYVLAAGNGRHEHIQGRPIGGRQRLRAVLSLRPARAEHRLRRRQGPPRPPRELLELRSDVRVDLHAPGVAIQSAYRSWYEMMDGTSMAAPHAAGALELVAARDPRAGATALKQRCCRPPSRSRAWPASR